jgi:hypothetical protein
MVLGLRPAVFTTWLWVLGCPSPEPPPPPPTEPPPETGHTGGEGPTGDTGTAPVPWVGDLALRVDPEVSLMLHATFDDPGVADVWVEYRFEGDDWQVAPLVAPGEAVLLGIPEQTAVEARAVAVIDGETAVGPTATATTGSLPQALLRPTVPTYDPALASPEGYAMISVASGSFTFQGPYFLEIVDRAGRVVWYTVVPGDLFSFYPSVAFDGTHIWYDAEDIFGFGTGSPHVTRRTLDGRWSVELAAPKAGQAFAEGPDDSFFYELRGSRHGVVQLDPDGETTLVWDCDAHIASIGEPGGDCLLNGCNWSEARGTVLASQFETGTVFEVDLATGLAVRQMGQLEPGEPYTFDPPESMFAYQHWPHWTPEGTLFVSTHLPCGGAQNCSEITGKPGIQVAAEYEVDDENRTLTRIWSHTSTDLWATQAGEAYRLPNGNLIQGYGQDGAVREIAPDGRTAWEVGWPKDGSGYRMVGHVSLIADLYALNVGH